MQGAHTNSAPVSCRSPKGRWHKLQLVPEGTTSLSQHARHNPPCAATGTPHSGHRGGNTKSITGVRKPSRAMTQRCLHDAGSWQDEPSRAVAGNGQRTSNNFRTKSA